MIERLQQSMQAMELLSRAQEVVANNLANINTPGYKADKLFYHAFTEMVNGKPVEETQAYQTVDMDQGRLESTGNPYDFAIQGKGFFQVEQNGQLLLTRNGRFHVDSSGYLRDEHNGYVMGDSGAIQIPSLSQTGSGNNGDNKPEVAKDGTIRMNDEIIGKLSLVQVTDTSQLQRMAGTYFKPESKGLIEPDTSSQVNQGYYEQGNVNVLSEMVSMTKNFQLFESQQRAIRATDQSLSETTTKLGNF